MKARLHVEASADAIAAACGLEGGALTLHVVEVTTDDGHTLRPLRIEARGRDDETSDAGAPVLVHIETRRGGHDG